MTLRVTRAEVEALGFDFPAAVAAHADAMTAHRSCVNEAAPTCHPLVAQAVRRVRAPLKSHAEARAEISSNICGELARGYETAIGNARQAIQRSRAGMTRLQRAAARVTGDPHAQTEAAVAATERQLAQLRSGALPECHQHMVPEGLPPVHAGPDEFVVDYVIVD